MAQTPWVSAYTLLELMDSDMLKLTEHVEEMKTLQQALKNELSLEEWSQQHITPEQLTSQIFRLGEFDQNLRRMTYLAQILSVNSF